MNIPYQFYIRCFSQSSIYRQAGVPASDIVFEKTERSDIENYQILQQIMKHYADQGYEIALDDVGAGHSGLNRVVNTTPDYLKADIWIFSLISYRIHLLCLLSSFYDHSHTCVNPLHQFTPNRVHGDVIRIPANEMNISSHDYRSGVHYIGNV